MVDLVVKRTGKVLGKLDGVIGSFILIMLLHISINN